MSALLSATPAPSCSTTSSYSAVRRLAESRPPCRRWSSAGLIVAPSPTVPGVEPEIVTATAQQDREAGARIVVVRAAWAVAVDPELPDVGAWGGALVIAVVEALLSRRPVAQLNRWLSAEVLASITLQQRRRRSGSGSSTVPRLVSARVQHPAPRVAEVAAFLRIGRRPLVLALRLEALGARWLCTALVVGPAPGTDLAVSLGRQQDAEATDGEPEQRRARA